MTSDLTLGVDSGTQSIKVVACDAAGQVVARASAPHSGACVQAPEDWWCALASASASLPADVRSQVGAVAVAGQQHGCVPLGRDRDVLGEASLWCDTSSAAEAERLNGLADFAAEVGSRLVASFTIAKLAALPAGVAAVCLPHDWLTFRLTGRLVTDRGDASGTGWWSAREGVRRDLLALAGRRDLEVPDVIEPGACAGTLTRAAAEALGLTAGIPVGAGTGDNMAAALGLGAREGELVVSLGTSGTVFAVSAEQTHDESGLVAGFADATGRFLPLACTLNCTAPVDLLARWFGMSTAEALDAAARDTEVVFLPYLSGERTPDLPAATGALVGLTPATEPADLVAAAVRGAAHGIAIGAAALGQAAGSCRLVGGGARHATWRQAVADALQVEVACPEGEDHAARGAAAQARAVLDGASVAGVAESWRPGVVEGATPRPAAAREIDETALRDALHPLWAAR